MTHQSTNDEGVGGRAAWKTSEHEEIPSQTGPVGGGPAGGWVRRVTRHVDPRHLRTVRLGSHLPTAFSIMEPN